MPEPSDQSIGAYRPRNKEQAKLLTNEIRCKITFKYSNAQPYLFFNSQLYEIKKCNLIVAKKRKKLDCLQSCFQIIPIFLYVVIVIGADAGARLFSENVRHLSCGLTAMETHFD